jgi:hypothetical protein
VEVLQWLALVVVMIRKGKRGLWPLVLAVVMALVLFMASPAEAG